LRKVIWPTREELWRMTGVVVVTVILFSLLIGGTDFVLGYAVKPIYNNQSTTAGNSTGGSTTITPTSTPSAGASASASTSASAAASASASASASPTT
jgi:preprotein translocase SecE subunit